MNQLSPTTYSGSQSVLPSDQPLIKDPTCQTNTDLAVLHAKYFEVQGSEDPKSLTVGPAMMQTQSTILQLLLNADGEGTADASLLLNIARDCATRNQPQPAMALAMKSLIASPKGREAAKLIKMLLTEFSDWQQIAHDLDKLSRNGVWKFPKSLLLEYLPQFDINWSINPCNRSDLLQQRSAFPAQNIPLTASKSLHKKVVKAYQYTETKTVEATTNVIPNGCLWFDGFNTVVWDHEGNIIEQLCIGYPEIIEYKSKQLTPLKLHGTIALIGNRGSTNYYHWMYDVIPKIAVLEASGFDTSTIDHFMVSGLKSRFQRQSLEQLGIENSRIHRPAAGCFVTADELLVPTFGSNDHPHRTPSELRHGIHLHQGAWASGFLKQSYSAGSSSTNQDLRIYITRGKSGTRATIDEENVISLLQRYGFETIDLKNYSIIEQANLFHRANTVVGVHGAGLTNITFCQPGTKVLELHGGYTNACFWVISQLTGLEHYSHLCRSKSPTNSTSESGPVQTNIAKARNAGVQISNDELEQLLHFANIRGPY